MNNGIKTIKPIESHVTDRDIFLGLLDAFGASVSSMPRNYKSRAYSDRWEYFDPEQVEDPEALPEYWKKVYKMHNRKEARDARDLKYRYVHTPTEIIPKHPRVPCKGIFRINNNEIHWDAITAEDLIHIRL